MFLHEKGLILVVQMSSLQFHWKNDNRVGRGLLGWGDMRITYAYPLSTDGFEGSDGQGHEQPMP